MHRAVRHFLCVLAVALGFASPQEGASPEPSREPFLDSV
jgi:hypothetical protein